MPRTVPPLLAADLAKGVTTTCWLLKIVPTNQNAAAFGMTTLDRDITYDDGGGPVDYLAASGVDAFDIDGSAALNVDNSQADTLLSQPYNVGMTLDGVVRGDYDDAAFKLMLVNYAALDHGNVLLLSGRVGQVTLRNNALAEIELRSLTDILKQNNLIGLTSITDRASLGDDHNKVTLRWYGGTVAAAGAESDRTFTSSVIPGSNSGVAGGTVIPMPGGDGGGWVTDSGSTSWITDDPRYQYLQVNYTDSVAYRDVPLPEGVMEGDQISMSYLVHGASGTIKVTLGFVGSSEVVESDATTPGGGWVSGALSLQVPVGRPDVRVTVTFDPAAGAGIGFVKPQLGSQLAIRSIVLNDSNYPEAGGSMANVVGVPFFTADGTATTAQLLDTSGEPITAGFAVQSIAKNGTTVDPTKYTVSATGLVTFLDGSPLVATAPPAGATFTWSGSLQTRPDGYFAPGVVHWDSGWNIGLEREVESYTAATGEITLAIPTPFAIMPGDNFHIRRDTDGSVAQAKSMGFLMNFRGEPWIPRGNASDLQAPTPRTA